MRMDAILLKTEMKTLTTGSAAKLSAGEKFHWPTHAMCRLNNKSSPTVEIPDKNIVSYSDRYYYTGQQLKSSLHFNQRYEVQAAFVPPPLCLNIIAVDLLHPRPP